MELRKDFEQKFKVFKVMRRGWNEWIRRSIGVKPRESIQYWNGVGVLLSSGWSTLEGVLESLDLTSVSQPS